MELRPYDPDRKTDRAGLWACKRRFETGLADDEAKAARYEAKLTDEYRRRWLTWVERCVSEQPRSVTLAVRTDASDERNAATESGETTAVDADTSETTVENGESGGTSSGASAVRGYAFLLPESSSFVWDAAVLNEIYVRPANRGTGLADDLMASVVSLAREQTLPLDRLVLDVDRENERARAFYDRHGFDHWGEMVAREL